MTSASSALKVLAEIVILEKTDHQVHLCATDSVFTSKRISTPAVVDHEAKGEIVGTNDHVLQKAHCGVHSPNPQMDDIPVGTMHAVIHIHHAQLDW